MKRMVQRTLGLVAGLFAILSATSSLAQTLSQQQTAAIDEAAKKALTVTGVPAASVAVVQGGKIVYVHAYGMQRQGQSAQVSARFAIGSVSKQFTAAAILLLADDGKLTLDDRVGKYLPTLTRANDVTIRQLLTHTSGYRDYFPQDYEPEFMKKPVSPMAILDRWARAPLDFEPGSQWQYSNTGYVAAGLIVEKVSGQPLDAFLHDRVFAKLGMAPVNAATDLQGADAFGHSRSAWGPVRTVPLNSPGWLFATGQLAMTASDLARWDISMIEQNVMSAAAYTTQRTEQLLRNGAGTDYGLGIYVKAVRGHRMLRHSGATTGFLSENRVYPDDRAAIVVLVNADYGNATESIADVIEAQLFATSTGVERARSLAEMLRSGRIDHAAFTANGNYALSPMVLADYRASLAPLRDPKSITQTQSTLRGGFTLERFTFDFGDKALQATLRAEPGDGGKVEEFMLTPIDR